MEDELVLLGAALLSVQRFELALHGLAAHIPKENNKNWNGEEFLRGDQSNFKQTLGMLKAVYAKELLLNDEDLDKLVKYRNILCHNYFRMTHAGVKNGNKLDDPIKFLEELIGLSNRYTSAILGLIASIMQHKDETYQHSDSETKNIAIYIEVVKQTLLEREVDKLWVEVEAITTSNEAVSIAAGIESKLVALAKIVKLIDLHPNKNRGEELRKGLFDSGLMDSIKLLEGQLKNI